MNENNHIPLHPNSAQAFILQSSISIYCDWKLKHEGIVTIKQSLLVSSNPYFMCHRVTYQSWESAQAAWSKCSANEDGGSGMCKKSKDVPILTQWGITPFLIMCQKTPYPLTYNCAVFCYQCRQGKCKSFAGIFNCFTNKIYSFPLFCNSHSWIKICSNLLVSRCSYNYLDTFLNRMVWTRNTTGTSCSCPVHSVSHCLIQSLQDTGNKNLAQELTRNFGLVSPNTFPSSIKSHTNLWCLFVLISAFLFSWSCQLHLTSVYNLKQSFLNQLYYYCPVMEMPLHLALHSPLTCKADKRKH